LAKTGFSEKTKILPDFLAPFVVISLLHSVVCVFCCSVLFVSTQY